MEQFSNQKLKLGFEIVTGTQSETSKGSPGSAVGFKCVNIGISETGIKDLSIVAMISHI
jgi:hypothetical protein